TATRCCSRAARRGWRCATRRPAGPSPLPTGHDDAVRSRRYRILAIGLPRRRGGRRLGLLVADYHLVYPCSSRDHRPYLLGLVHDEVEQDRLLLGESLGDDARRRLTVEDVVA